MGAEIVNLRRARKAKQQAEKEKTAKANRVVHGTPKHLRKLSEARKNKAEQRLASHKLEKDAGDAGSVGESQSD
jgi:hypothetical protein